MKRWLISKFNGDVISCYKNKTGAIFKTCVFCLSSLINALMPHKKESFIPQRYAWKTLCSSKTLLVTHGKFYLSRELLLLSHNAKYYIKSLERNKVKLFDIRGLWKKKKIFRRKYSVDTLTDTATVDFNFASWSGESKKWQ